MRGIGAAAAAARRHTHLPSSYAAAFSGIGGGGGAGRGRGRGLPPSAQPRAPGSPIPHDDDGADPFSAPASVGRGRGEPVIPSSPIIPSFSSLSGAGRRPQPSPSLRRRGAMASLAPRLLRRRPVLSAAALSSIRYGSTAVTLNTDGGFARFAVSDACAKQEGRKQPPAKKKMSRKAKVNQLKWYRLKAKKKMKSPNPEVRIRYKLEKAKRKEEWLIEKLRKYEVPRAPEPVHDPEILTEEEIFYLKRTGEKRNNYVPVGRRGVFGGVVLNMHLHWKKHETVKVVCKPCRPGQVYEYAEDLARLSKGTVIDIKPNNTIIFYRGKNYVQPKVMSPPDTLSKQKALEKYRYEQSLEHTSQFIENLEKELEDYQKHVALFKNREGAISEKISNKDTTVDDLTTSSDTECAVSFIN